MPWDDEPDDESPGGHPPLPPEDRLWRHPSELAHAAVRPAPGPPPGSPRWPVVVAAGLVGASLSAGAIAATGSLPSRVVERSVVEKVALTPIVSSPLLRDDGDVAAVVERLGPAIARIDLERAGDTTTGTAVLFRDDGLLLTSARLVEGASILTVVLSDGRAFEGELVGADPLTDVAVLRIDGDDLPVAVIGSSSTLRVGSPTVVVGSASSSGGPWVATGVVSALARQVEDATGANLHGLIEVDQPIAPGASGGALVDASGAVVGIATNPGQSAGSFGLALPIDLVRRIADDLIATGRVAHGWLGVHAEDLTRAQMAGMGIDGGALVRDVSGGGPAATAGLEPEDVITEVDGDDIDSTSALVLELREHGPGDEVVVGYWRDGREEERTVTLGERP